MSDYEDIIPSAEVIKERETEWLNFFVKFKQFNDESNDSSDLHYDDIFDYKEDKDNMEIMCEVSKDDSDDENNNLNENKDKILAIAEKRKKIFNEMGFFEKLNFFDSNQGHQSMNWMQSNFSQSYLDSDGFGRTSHHRQEISVFHFSNQNLNGQIPFSNYFNNSSVMQNQTPNFYNTLLRNNSLQSINGIQPIDKRDLDFRQRSFSTDSFRKNDKTSNLRAIEGVNCRGSENKENRPREIHTYSDSNDSFSSLNYSQQRNRIKKTKKKYKTNKTRESPKEILKSEEIIFLISSESDSDLIANKKVNGKKTIIHKSDVDVKLIKDYFKIPKSTEMKRVKTDALNFESDKTSTEGDKMVPSRGLSEKELGECLFFIYFFLF